MKIFYALLVMISASFLFMLPITGMVYDFRTDQQTNTFPSTATATLSTTANITLSTALYKNDTASITITSNTSAEVPSISSYNSTSRQLTVGTLNGGTIRLLTVTYDITALNDAESLDALLDKVPLIWMLMVICFAPAALASMFVGRN